MRNSIKILGEVSFSNLTNWSVQYLLDTSFSYNQDFKLVSIGDFLTRNKTSILVQDNKEYKRVTIKIRNGGIFLRDKLIGSSIGTKKQFVINEGQFLLSKIDARNGAFGVVPKDVDNGIITGNFWTFDVDYDLINPHFLSLMVTTPEFIKFSENASNGTTNRHYLQEDLFLAQKIPLPPLPEQNRIVENYNKKIKLATEQEKKAEKFKEGLSVYVDSSLGIVINEKLENTGSGIIKTVNYKDFEKWGVNAQTNTKITFNKNYRISTIAQLSDISSGGTPSRSRPKYYTGDIPWIKTGEVINDIIFDTEEKITSEAIKNSSAKLYNKGSLIIAMYGQGKTRGRTAKIGVKATTNQACAVIHNIDNSTILTDYLWTYLINEYDRLRELASGNNQPNLNAQMIKNYPVVIPPLDIQQEIIIEVFNLKQQIKDLKIKAKQNRNNAIEEFEQEIFIKN